MVSRYYHEDARIERLAIQEIQEMLSRYNGYNFERVAACVEAKLEITKAAKKR